MSTTEIIRVVATPDGKVEAFYRFIGADGEPQTAGTYVNVPGGPELVAAALAVVDAQLGDVTVTTTQPAAVVAAMTALGALKAQAAQVQRDLDAKAEQAAALDQQIAAKQMAVADTVPAAAETKPMGVP